MVQGISNTSTLTKPKWMIWTPIGRWYYDTDPVSEQKMKDKYAELLAKYPNMEITKYQLNPGDKVW